MLLVEEAVDIDREIYLSITVDPVESKIMLIGCAEGGVEIEKLAATDPDKIVTVRVDIAEGLGGYHVNNLIYGMGLSGDLGKQVGAVVRGLYKTFRAYDAQLAEINPLFITKDGKAIAGDGKLIIDDNSVWRQPNYPLTRDYFDSEVEFEAAQEGIPYLQFNGDIALMCAGAGLTTTVFDLINDAGGHPATYVEFGGANYTKAVRTMELCLKTPSKVILVVTFGTIARADVMAQGLVEAIKVHQPKQPIVTCIRGTNEEEAFAILRDAGLEPLTNTEEAVQRAVDIADGRALMSIFIHKDSRVVVQGVTGKEGAFWAEAHERHGHAGRLRRHPRQGRAGRGRHPGVPFRPPGHKGPPRRRRHAVRAPQVHQGRRGLRPSTRASKRSAPSRTASRCTKPSRSAGPRFPAARWSWAATPRASSPWAKPCSAPSPTGSTAYIRRATSGS